MTKAKTIPCPICKAPSVTRYKPFCSQRCSDLDLGRWLKGTYVIPGNETVSPSDDPASAAREDDRDF
jgi:endogenous inhibitor of DNA gyrase (YacG/DUF329 family)